MFEIWKYINWFGKEPFHPLQRTSYVLSVKDNHPTLKQDIADYIHDSALRKTMDNHKTVEKNRGRVESRTALTAFTTSDIDWLFGKSD